jgi:sorbose reductase
VSKAADVQAKIKAVVADFGKLDCLVANAGMAISKPVLETSIEEYKRQMEVNGE